MLVSFGLLFCCLILCLICSGARIMSSMKSILFLVAIPCNFPAIAISIAITKLILLHDHKDKINKTYQFIET